MWKIRHKKTGLFYTPLNEGQKWGRTNLSRYGKIYEKKPDLARIKKFCITAKVKNLDGHGTVSVSKTYDFKPDFWEVIKLVSN